MERPPGRFIFQKRSPWRGPASPRPARRPRSLRRRLLEGLSRLLFRLGFRRMVVMPDFDYQAEGYKPPEDEPAAPGAAVWATARPFVLGAGAFVLIAGLVMFIYGLLPHAAAVGSQSAAAAMALAAMRKLESGDGQGGLSLAAAAYAVKPPGYGAAYLDGFLKTAAPKLPPPPGAGQRRGRAAELMAQAGRCRARSDPLGAAEALSKAVEAHPRDPVLRLLRADAQMGAGQPAAALRDTEGLALAGLVGPVTLLRARACWQLNQPDRAVEELTRGLEQAPDANDLRLELANAYLATGNPKQAVAEARAVLAFAPDNAAAYLTMARACEQAGDTAGVEAVLRKGVAVAPRNAAALNDLAWFLADKRGRPQEALPYARRACEVTPRDPACLDTLAWIYHLLGHDAAAVALLRKAVAISPGDPEARLHLGQILLRTGKAAQGAALLRQLAAGSAPAAVREQARRELAEHGAKSPSQPG